MVDYFDANAADGTAATTDAAATVNGKAAPATNGEEIGMDEISVSLLQVSKLRPADQYRSELSNTFGLVLKKTQIIKDGWLCTRGNRLQMHIGYFLSPFSSVLPLWLEEITHEMCSQSTTNNQKCNVSFQGSQWALHRLSDCTIENWYFIVYRIPI